MKSNYLLLKKYTKLIKKGRHIEMLSFFGVKKNLRMKAKGSYLEELKLEMEYVNVYIKV